MMQQSLLLIAIVSVAFACSSKADGTAVNNTAIPGCYAYINSGKDSVLLHLSVADNAVTGHMVYKLHEKYANQGTIHGELKGDTHL
jgi:hypothetical protein